MVDDYGHHPTEIRATLSAIKQAWPEKRLVVLFQPHRLSRTQALWDDFCRVFHQADRLLLTDVYPASEEPIPGVDAEGLARGAARAAIVWDGADWRALGLEAAIVVPRPTTSAV